MLAAGSLFDLKLDPRDRAGGPLQPARPKSATGGGKPPSPKKSRKPRRKKSRPRHAAPALLLVLRARHLGRGRGRRRRGFAHDEAAADSIARGAEAAADDHDSRPRRQDRRDARRHGRRRDSAESAAALSSAGLRRDRGPPLLSPFRPRSDRARARGGGEPRRARRARGRLDAHPAAREELVSDARAHRLAQDRRGHHRARAREGIFQEPNSRILSQPRLFRLRRLRRRGGGAALFRKIRARRHAGRSRDARGPREGAVAARAHAQSAARARARRNRLERDGRWRFRFRARWRRPRARARRRSSRTTGRARPAMSATG